MLKYVLTLACCAMGFLSIAQNNMVPVDKSAMDVSYCPAGFPVLKIQDKASEPLLARVLYSRPSKNGRVVMGELLEYGKVWRLGANEATELELYQNAKIGGNKVKKGRYTLYCIPNIDKWTIIVNKETDTWGSFKYDVKKDVVRYDAPVTKMTDLVETFTMLFEKSAGGYNLIIAWDDTKVIVPFSL